MNCVRKVGNSRTGVTRDVQVDKIITRVLSCSFDKSSWLLTMKINNVLYIQLSVGGCISTTLQHNTDLSFCCCCFLLCLHSLFLHK